MGKTMPCRENSMCKGTEVYKTLVHLGRVSNSRRPRSSACERAGRDEAEEANKGQNIRDLIRPLKSWGCTLKMVGNR